MCEQLMTIMLNGSDLTVTRDPGRLNPAGRAGQIDGYHAPMQDQSRVLITPA
jgi:hypothetical protein